MTQTFRNFVNGEFVDAASGETYDVIDPTTGEVYAPAPLSRAEDVDRAYAAADDAFEPLGRHHAAGAVARRCSRSPTRSRTGPTRSCKVECKDTGKPLGLTAEEEMPPAIDHFRFFAGAARVLEGKSAGEYMADHTSLIRREPIGVVGQVTPWNYPLMMMVWKIAPALAAGNTVVLKPSDTTPATSTLLAEIVQEFLPPGVLNVVCGDRDTGRALVGTQDPADGRDHRLGAGRHGGGRVGGRRPEAGAPRARRQGAGDRVRRRRRRDGRRGDRRGRLLQRRPGLHRRHPGARRAAASTTTSSPR